MEMELTTYLTQLRTNKHMTKAALAEKLRVSPAIVSQWESGEALPNFKSLKKLSYFYKISADDFINKWTP